MTAHVLRTLALGIYDWTKAHHDVRPAGVIMCPDDHEALLQAVWGDDRSITDLRNVLGMRVVVDPKLKPADFVFWEPGEV